MPSGSCSDFSLFRIYETGFVHMGFEVGHREESENHVVTAKSLIESFAAWRRFWDEEAPTGTFTGGFIAAVNSVSSAQDFRFMAESKSA